MGESAFHSESWASVMFTDTSEDTEHLFTSGSPEAVKALGEYMDTQQEGYSMTLNHTDAGALVRAIGAMLNGTPDILVFDNEDALARERTGEPITAADFLTGFLSDMAAEAKMEWV